MLTFGDHCGACCTICCAFLHMSAQIPASAGSLVALTDLKATQNRFTAIHPDAAAGWGQMEVLNLNRNVLTSLPTTAGAWVELKSLDLRANKLTALDEEALGAWTKMEVIPCVCRA